MKSNLIKKAGLTLASLLAMYGIAKSQDTTNVSPVVDTAIVAPASPSILNENVFDQFEETHAHRLEINKLINKKGGINYILSNAIPAQVLFENNNDTITEYVTGFFSVISPAAQTIFEKHGITPYTDKELQKLGVQLLDSAVYEPTGEFKQYTEIKNILKGEKTNFFPTKLNIVHVEETPKGTEYTVFAKIKGVSRLSRDNDPLDSQVVLDFTSEYEPTKEKKKKDRKPLEFNYNAAISAGAYTLATGGTVLGELSAQFPVTKKWGLNLAGLMPITSVDKEVTTTSSTEELQSLEVAGGMKAIDSKTYMSTKEQSLSHIVLGGLYTNLNETFTLSGSLGAAFYNTNGWESQSFNGEVLNVSGVYLFDRVVPADIVEANGGAFENRDMKLDDEVKTAYQVKLTAFPGPKKHVGIGAGVTGVGSDVYVGGSLTFKL